MPAARRRKICCAYAEPEPKPKKPRAPPKKLTPEEKEQKAKEKLERAALKEKQQKWEETLKPFTDGSFMFPKGTKGMFISDAKRVFGLTQTDVESLRIERIQNSPKRFVSADDAEALAKRKYEFFHGPGSGVNYVSPVNIWNSFDLTHTKRENNGRRTKTNWGIHSSYRRY